MINDKSLSSQRLFSSPSFSPLLVRELLLPAPELSPLQVVFATRPPLLQTVNLQCLQVRYNLNLARLYNISRESYQTEQRMNE